MILSLANLPERSVLPAASAAVLASSGLDLAAQEFGLCLQDCLEPAQSTLQCETENTAPFALSIDMSESGAISLPDLPFPPAMPLLETPLARTRAVFNGEVSKAVAGEDPGNAQVEPMPSVPVVLLQPTPPATPLVAEGPSAAPPLQAGEGSLEPADAAGTSEIQPGSIIDPSPTAGPRSDVPAVAALPQRLSSFRAAAMPDSPDPGLSEWTQGPETATATTSASGKPTLNQMTGLQVAMPLPDAPELPANGKPEAPAASSLSRAGSDAMPQGVVQSGRPALPGDAALAIATQPTAAGAKPILNQTTGLQVAMPLPDAPELPANGKPEAPAASSLSRAASDAMPQGVVQSGRPVAPENVARTSVRPTAPDSGNLVLNQVANAPTKASAAPMVDGREGTPSLQAEAAGTQIIAPAADGRPPAIQVRQEGADAARVAVPLTPMANLVPPARQPISSAPAATTEGASQSGPAAQVSAEPTADGRAPEPAPQDAEGSSDHLRADQPDEPLQPATSVTSRPRSRAAAPEVDPAAPQEPGPSQRQNRAEVSPATAPYASSLPAPAAPQTAIAISGAVGLTADGAAAPPSPQPPSSAPLPERLATSQPGWTEGLASAASRLTADGGTLVLQLTPEGLGEVQITVTVEGPEAQVSFRTETPEAARVLSQAAPDLAADLARHGMALTGHQARSDGDGRGHAPPPPPEAPRIRSRGGPAQAEAATPTPKAPLINLIA